MIHFYLIKTISGEYGNQESTPIVEPWHVGGVVHGLFTCDDGRMVVYGTLPNYLLGYPSEVRELTREEARGLSLAKYPEHDEVVTGPDGVTEVVHVPARDLTMGVGE